MSINAGGDIPVLGENGRPINNPLVILNNHLGHLEQISHALQNLALNSKPMLPHVYTQQVVNDPGHGAVWGTFCLACTQEAEEYTYPCKHAPEEQFKPPAFFTIGDVFEPDEHGRLLKHGTPSA